MKTQLSLKLWIIIILVAVNIITANSQLTSFEMTNEEAIQVVLRKFEELVLSDTFPINGSPIGLWELRQFKIQNRDTVFIERGNFVVIEKNAEKQQFYLGKLDLFNPDSNITIKGEFSENSLKLNNSVVFTEIDKNGEIITFKRKERNNISDEILLKRVFPPSNDYIGGEIKNSLDEVKRVFAEMETYSGSGVVFLADANYCYILTANHVVENANDISIKLPGTCEVLKGRVLASDTELDIAIIEVRFDIGTYGLILKDSVKKNKTNYKEIPSVPIYFDFSELKVNETVTCQGYPSGDAISTCPTSTTGKVNNINISKPFSVAADFVSLPGNSGGPIFKNGSLIGIMTSKISENFIQTSDFSVFTSLVEFPSFLRRNNLQWVLDEIKSRKNMLEMYDQSQQIEILKRYTCLLIVKKNQTEE